jgi:hypothetical protein
MAIVKFPVVFMGGWLFNFILDVQFLVGFAAGWFAHTWIGNLLL